MSYYQRSLFDEMAEPHDLLDQCFANKSIALRRGKIFEVVPGELDTTGLIRDERIEGMLMGVAVGDSLGHSTEWKYDPASRHQRFGTIADHLTDSDMRAGRISDDSQMTMWTVERLLRCGRFDFEDLVGCFVNRQSMIVGMGRNTAASLDRHRRRLRGATIAIHECIGDPSNEGRGNGAAMRFSPIVLPHLKQPSKKLWEDAVLSAFVTHGNTVALSSAVALTHLLWRVLERPCGDTPKAQWWLDEYLSVANDLEISELPFPINTDPVPKWMVGFRGTLCDFLDDVVRGAFRKGIPLVTACSLDGFGSRADCTQTIPALLYVLMCHADSFESTIITSVNDTKDNDSIAAIAGAFVGALHGKNRIRKRWFDGIRSYSLKCSGLETLSDREAISKLCQDAVSSFLGGRRESTYPNS